MAMASSSSPVRKRRRRFNFLILPPALWFCFGRGCAIPLSSTTNSSPPPTPTPTTGWFITQNQSLDFYHLPISPFTLQNCPNIGFCFTNSPLTLNFCSSTSFDFHNNSFLSSKLKFIISNSITEGCNNSVLLLGPRGNGKSAVLELVLQDLKMEHPDMLSLVRLNGLLHSEDNCGLKEIAKQLCLEHHLSFSKMASSDENSDFLIDMLRECGLAHKTLIFILEEFDLFAQGKQRLLYTLLDALQSLSSQAVVIGVSCRLDADQLLEKRVRSRFSHRKLLFVPPSDEDIERLLEHLLYLPKDADLSPNYVLEFNSRLQNMFNSKEFKDILGLVLDVDRSTSCLVMFLFRVVCSMDPHSGFLSLENFKTVSEILQRQPKLESIQSTSILELYILVCMNRLEAKEQISYNFNSIMKEYNAIHDAYKTSDFRSREVCLRAFEHLLERGLIAFSDSSVRFQTIEYRPVKLLISSHELYPGLKAYNSRPVILLKLFNHESFK